MSKKKKAGKNEVCECGKHDVEFSISVLGGHWKNLCYDCTKEFCAKKGLAFLGGNWGCYPYTFARIPEVKKDE